MENHLIVCGAGRVGSVIINELYTTKREFVIIEKDEEVIHEIEERLPGVPIVHGNADFEDVLAKAGINTASGIFASTGDDNQNLIISLTSKYVNPKIRVVARCLEAVNHTKMQKAGADAVITENFIAGMRMASEMIRPAVVNFLDKMLKDTDGNLRVEEIIIKGKHVNKKIAELGLGNFPSTLLLAIVSDEQKWTYNPKPQELVKSDYKLVVITNPEERLELKKHFSDI